MGPLEVTCKDKMHLILQTFSWLDQIRWQEPGNYDLINYYTADLTDDEKLLTHWLCYITDRQTPFQRIWEVGGYVLSHIARAYSRDRGDVLALLRKYTRQEPDSRGRVHVWLECDLKQANARLERYEITEGPVQFASRYMPEDLVLIFRTLALLDELADRSLARFIAQAASGNDDSRHAIRRIAAGLDGLTYSAGGTVRAERVDDELEDMQKKVTQDAEAFRRDPHSCIDGWDANFRYFERKRLWCSLRDYLKSPEFNDAFVGALKAANRPDVDRWERGNQCLRAGLHALELPGDVWNNSPTFRRGLFSPYLRQERQSWNMPRTIRAIYELLTEDEDLAFYPEQLDVTFDFVPAMCERNMCGTCLFGSGVGEVCHAQSGLQCSVALAACGYEHKCDPADCPVRDDRVKGFCHSAVGLKGQA